MILENQIEEIGKFLKTHGLKGELNANLDIDADFISSERPLIISVDGIFVPFFPESFRPKGHFSVLIKLLGIDSEAEARQFVNKTIYGLRSEIEEFIGPEEEDDDGFYAEDMIGYQVVADGDDKPIGRITDVAYSTANVLFIVEDLQGETLYIPVSPDFIVGIDYENHIIRMNLPQGLIELNRREKE